MSVFAFARSSCRLPSFELHSLQSGVNYGVKLFAFNDKGASNVTRVPIYTLKNPEKQTDFMAKAPLIEEIRPFLPVIMGASGGLVLMGLLIIVVVRMRCARDDQQQHHHHGRDINTVNSSCGNHSPPSDRLHTGN